MRNEFPPEPRSEDKKERLHRMENLAYEFRQAEKQNDAEASERILQELEEMGVSNEELSSAERLQGLLDARCIKEARDILEAPGPREDKILQIAALSMSQHAHEQVGDVREEVSEIQQKAFKHLRGQGFSYNDLKEELSSNIVKLAFQDELKRIADEKKQVKK